ncbi:Gag-Pol polyprotein [Bienertia sinuspersici]
MFHGGNFQSVGNKVVYCGRQCKTFRIDPDELSWWDLEERAKECGNYTHIESIHYLLPGLGFDKGLRRVYNDDEVREMGGLILKDPRPDSPIPVDTLVGNHSDDGDDDDSDTEYQPLSESSEGEVVGSEGEETGGEDDTLFDAEDDLDEEERALDTARKDELEGDNGDTSDEEFFTARERVRGCNAKLPEIASQLQKDANEGRLGSQVRGEALNAARSEQLEGCVSDYEQSDEEVHTPPDSGEDEALHERRSKRSLLVSLESDFKLFSWKVGQRFATRSDFKKAVAKYGIYQGRNVSIKISNKSRQQRVGVRCLNGCPFQLYASWDSRRSSFVVKTVREEHTCTRNMKKNKQLKYKWVAEQLLDVFKARPHWPGKEIVETIRRGFKIVISVDFAYKVKKAAHKMLHGSMKDHYAKLGRYIEAIIKCSPGTHISLVSTMEHDTPPQIFQRLFVSFEGLQKGWKEGCRKIICVDACFLKTFLGGQLLSAVERDGNDQMYPIAWAVVEGLGEGNELVIVSDEHQSILNGVASVFPNAEHRHCARHVFALWHKSFRGDEMKLAFWNIVKAYNMTDFNEALSDLAEKNPAAANAFKAYNPEVFCRSHMQVNVKADVVTNNMAETFNGYIIHARTKHLIYMLEDIRTSLMQRLVVKRREVEKWKSNISPRILVKLEKEKTEAAMCEVLPSTETLFQVNYFLDSLNVDLEARTLSIPPMEGERYWPSSDLHLDPPPIKIGPGRPRKNRRKDPFEDPKNPGKLSRHGMEMTCFICKAKGHNKRRCPNKDQAQIQEPPPKRPRGRPKSSAQPTPLSTQTENVPPQHHENTFEPTRLGKNGRIIFSGRGSRGGGTSKGGGRGSRGGGTSRGKGRGQGGNGGGRSRMPVGVGVLVTENGLFTNVPGGSGPKSVTNSSVVNTFGGNLSQGSTFGQGR